MISKLGKKMIALTTYSALAGGALMLSTQGASALDCGGWVIGANTSVNNMSCSCNGSSGTVQDAGTSWHFLLVNHTAGQAGSFSQGLGWPGPNGSLTIVTDRGVNDGSSGNNQAPDYLVIGCLADDGVQLL